MKKLFSLIELLIVIAVILILISLLQPALRRAITNAYIVSCMGNLRQFGIASHLFASDNNGNTMVTVTQWRSMYPNYLRIDSENSPDNNPDEWSIDLINVYLPGAIDIDRTSNAVGGIAMCPNIEEDLLNRFIEVRNFGQGHSFIEIQYTYFAGVDQYPERSAIQKGAIDDLAYRKIENEPNRILVTDILYWDESDSRRANLGNWRYNHARDGHWAFNEYDWLPIDTGDIPNSWGMNRVFADGSAEWSYTAHIDGFEVLNQPLLYPGGAVGRTGQDTFYYGNAVK